jgi:hypothetical protein
MVLDEQDREAIDDAASAATYGIAKFFWPVILGVGVLVLIGFGLSATGIIRIGIERENIRHSQQFNESKSGYVGELIAEYNALATGIAEAEDNMKTSVAKAKRAQQKAVLTNIHRQAKLMPVYQRPADIKEFLEEHPLN